MNELEKTRRDIGKKLRALRKARQWTQVELSKQLQVSQGQLSEIEHGAASLTAEQFLVVLKLFNVGASHFSAPAPDPGVELQNVLARLGASHLREVENTLPSEQLEVVGDAVREAIVTGSPRHITALAPVLVRNVDRVSLKKLRAELLAMGLARRLDWLVANTVAAIREELALSPPAPWAQRYRRALVVLEAHLEFFERASPTRDSRLDPPDILDVQIRSKQTLADVQSSSSPFSQRWGIVTSIQPEDFIRALEAARATG